MKVGYGSVAEDAVWAGVDTHAAANWLSVVDARGSELFSGEFAADPEGYRRLCDEIRRLGSPVAAGVECTGTYGAGLVRAMAAYGITCYEVITPGRPRRGPGCDKDDAADALRAARQALSGENLAVPKSQDGWVEEVRNMTVAREELVKQCTSLANLSLATVRKGPDEIRARLERLGTTKMMGVLAGWDEVEADPICDAVMLSLAALGRVWAEARRSARLLEERIEKALKAGNPALASMYGCGPISAAMLAIAAGDNPERMGSEASFAALCGVSPIRASSGKVKRHRLNRGGNRNANKALHIIAMHRMRTDPRTIEYVERRRAEGLSDREIRRCVKRYIAREAYRLIMHPYDVPIEGKGPEMRAERIASGVSQKDAAIALGVTASTLCELELGHHQFRELALRYRQWIDDGFPLEAGIAS